MTNTPLEKGYYSRNEVAVWRLFIFYWLLASKGRLIDRIYGLRSIVCTILFDVYFGKFVMIFIDIAEIGCMSIPKCNGNCGKYGQTHLICCMMLPVGVVLCMLGQYWVFPPLSAIITVRRCGMLATRCCRHSTGISAHLSDMAWRSSPRFWGGLSMLVIALPNSSQICYMGLQSGDLGDIALPEEFKDNPSTGKCGLIVLVTVVIPKMLSGKWH